MAESPSHRFGQVIGNLLEALMLPVLLEFCKERDLYLDRHGQRLNVRGGKKVSWGDKYGNSHDLDFVIEKGGSTDKRGRPVAFIETAWRRYTKHSRNKAQEIQGAVLPIADEWELDRPFLGAVLAGIFTKGALDQLASVGFEVVYLSYDSIVSAFEKVGVDVRFEEGTPDEEFSKCLGKINTLSEEELEKLKGHIFEVNKVGFERFFAALRKKLDRLVERIMVTPLFGNPETFAHIDDAMAFIEAFDVAVSSGKFRKYEVSVAFSNGDHVQGIFTDRERAREFLRYVTS